MKKIPVDCRECGSTDIEWNYSLHTDSGVQDGRLRLHDVQVLCYLGCNECSETLASICLDSLLTQVNRRGIAK